MPLGSWLFDDTPYIIQQNHPPLFKFLYMRGGGGAGGRDYLLLFLNIKRIIIEKYPYYPMKCTLSSNKFHQWIKYLKFKLGTFILNRHIKIDKANIVLLWRHKFWDRISEVEKKISSKELGEIGFPFYCDLWRQNRIIWTLS